MVENYHKIHLFLRKIIILKRIIVSVTNDLAGDQRVHRVCLTLKSMGFDILLIGRRLQTSSPMPGRTYGTSLMRLLFRKGPLFYAEYNFRLFLLLLFSRFDLLLSNDLDTLPANWLAAKLKHKPLVYDSHEYFTEVPELVGRRQVQKIWEWLERRLVPGVDQAYTVSKSIADVYLEKYKIPFQVVRNLPLPVAAGKKSADKEPGPLFTIIYQGALNKGRGLEQAIYAMKYLPEFNLLLAGTGDIKDDLKAQAADLQLRNVQFTGRLPFDELMQVTCKANLGISIEEDFGLNYRFALPNKLFDYIQARIPVVVSDLPEMSAVVKKYEIGLIIPNHDPVIVAEAFRKALTDQTLREKWSANLETAAEELTWEKEEIKVRKIFERYL
jgi:glycosyltransferase involved in cell wall biosynthesis